MAAPGEGDWLLDVDEDYLLASLGSAFPPGSDAWRTRARAFGDEEWDYSNVTSAGTITVLTEIPEETVEVQAQYCLEENSEPVSEWSVTKTWPV